MPTQDDLTRRVQTLASISVAYNLFEAAISLTTGIRSRSIGLIGFGLDSIIETGSALIVLWQFRHPVPKDRERMALRLIAVSFYLLATYVVLESTRCLLTQNSPDHTSLGIFIAALSLVVMPILSVMKKQAGEKLGSPTAIADSRQTLLCTYLSAILLSGLLLNSLFGWWWADPIVGLFVAVLAIREGREAWKGDACCG